MVKTSERQDGFTLVEVLVAATLMAMVMLGTLLLYGQGIRDWIWCEHYAEVLENLRLGVESMVYDLQGATDITVYDGGLRLAFMTGNGLVEYQYDDDENELEKKYHGPLTTGVITSARFSVDPVFPTLVQIQLTGKSSPVTREITVRTKVYAGGP
jgi:prepilin-type N-terminal cleavage/methylation domain-containing protein